MDCRRHLSRLGAMLLAVALSACTTRYAVKEEAARLPALDRPAAITRIPLTVGLYIPKEVREHVATGGHKMMEIDVPVAETTVPYFRWATEQLFTRVVPLDSIAPEARAGSALAGVIELASARSHTFTLRLHADGRDPVEWLVAGVSSDAGGPAIGYHTTRSVTNSLRDAIAQYLVHFPRQPGMREWLDRHGVTGGVEPNFTQGGSPEAGERIVALRNDAEARDCLEHRVAENGKRGTFLPGLAFRQALFPWFESSTAPEKEDDMLAFVSLPAIRQRIEAQGVRYLLDFKGGTRHVTNEALSGGGCGYAGCGGIYAGTRYTSFNAALYDLRVGRKIFEGDANRSAGFTVLMIGIPIPFIPATESDACKDLAARVTQVMKEAGER